MSSTHKPSCDSSGIEVAGADKLSGIPLEGQLQQVIYTELEEERINWAN